MSAQFAPFEPSLASLITGLAERAADNLSEQELTFLSTFSDSAESQARHMAELAEGLGCLVSADRNASPREGSFQDASSCSRLLFSLADMARNVEALLALRGEVEHLQHHRAYQEANKAADGGAA